MIEVLKDGTNKKFFAVCPNCLSEMAYERKDTDIKETGEKLFGNPLVDSFIICPICGESIRVCFQPLEDGKNA